MNATQENTGDRALLEWAGQQLHEVAFSSDDMADLAPLRSMIGDATIVSLGEGLHGSAEPLEFRNRLFRCLVEEMGFTGIALESGITEGFLVNDYVLGAPGDAKSVAARGITSGLGGFPQQAALIEWMRGYNADPAHPRKIAFYGMDVSGEPAAQDSALESALHYLDEVDAAAAAALRARIAPFLFRLKIDRFSDDPDHYAHLAQSGRDTVTAAIADLITQIEVGEGAYIAATSACQYALAYRAAVAARQTDDYLRQFPVGWTPEAHGMGAAVGSVGVVDRAKMDNLEWILKQSGPDAKLLVFAHLGHVATTHVSVRIPDQDPIDLPPMVGEYLARRYGSRLVTIGHLFARDAGDDAQERPPAPPVSLEGLFAALNVPAFVLDLRSAPPGAKRRLQPTHALYGGQRPVHSLRIGEGVDIVLFTDRATSAGAA